MRSCWMLGFEGSMISLLEDKGCSCFICQSLRERCSSLPIRDAKICDIGFMRTC